MSNPDAVDPKIIKIIDKLTGRARKVCDYILQNGAITTEVIANELGYEHPPRAIRDVRESGIPIKTSMTKDSSGKRCAIYAFDDPSKIIEGRHQGRTQFPKKFKEKLYSSQNGKCAITGASLDIRYLQVDHRVPYQVQGDSDSMDLLEADYMLITGECQRQKSWSCEQCPNFLLHMQIETCKSCYWAHPENYKHSECKDLYRLYILYQGEQARTLAEMTKDNTNDEINEIIFNALCNQ